MSSSQPLWRWSELCAVFGLSSQPGADIQGLCIDSRRVHSGDLFIALAGDPGPRFNGAGGASRDGHEFVASAVSKGASGLMLSQAIASAMTSDVPVLQVPDTLDGLWRLGEVGRQRMQGKVVGITGSSGKTTARQWLEVLLGVQGRTHASVGSFNNHWGVPLSLARMPADSDFGLFEIGMSHPGEIEPLAVLAHMDVALVLNVSPAHLGQFENIEGIRREKLSIAAGLKAGGTLVVPADLNLDGVNLAGINPDGASDNNVGETRVLTFGLGEDADVYGVAEYRHDYTLVQVESLGQRWSYRLQAGGEHRVLTSLASFAVLLALGADLDQASQDMPQLTMPAGRGDEVLIGQRYVIDDSYNANPVSMGYALKSLSDRGGNTQKVALLGEMLELGVQGPEMHQQLLPACAGFDGVITVGDGFADWDAGVLGSRYWGHFNKAAEIDLALLVAKLDDDAVMLIKGSNQVFWVNDFVNTLRRYLVELSG
ncbi:MAG: UDP-N-acetylmuramoyl-tripeptide--D-alanyl-D-alanine ligase [Urechidicola sp.]